jgi:hypothetical protein
MTKNIKCLVRESKKNVTGLVEVICELPRLILRGGIVFLPMLILIVSLLVIRPTSEGDPAASFVIGGFILVCLPISMLWMFIVGAPIDTVYFSPDGESKGLVTRMKENAIDCGRGALFLIKVLPMGVIIISTVFLPFILGTIYYVYTQPVVFQTTPITELPGMDVLTVGVLVIITLIWAVLIGIPVASCYLFPVLDRLAFPDTPIENE